MTDHGYTNEVHSGASHITTPCSSPEVGRQLTGQTHGQAPILIMATGTVGKIGVLLGMPKLLLTFRDGNLLMAEVEAYIIEKIAGVADRKYMEVFIHNTEISHLGLIKKETEETMKKILASIHNTKVTTWIQLTTAIHHLAPLTSNYYILRVKSTINVSKGLLKIMVMAKVQKQRRHPVGHHILQLQLENPHQWMIPKYLQTKCFYRLLT